jgi:hypothetical protein
MISFWRESELLGFVLTSAEDSLLRRRGRPSLRWTVFTSSWVYLRIFGGIDRKVIPQATGGGSEIVGILFDH